MRLSIKRSQQALQDQTDIWLNIAEDNLRAADGVYERINDAIAMLAEHPEAGRGRDDLRAGLRYFPVGSYLIFYTIAPGILGIRRIVHGARDIKAALFDD
jgi:toxin ParE1/3/4